MERPREEARRERKGQKGQTSGIQQQHLRIVRIMTRRTQIPGINLTGNNKKNLEKKDTRNHKH
eukprot:10085100-Prorocentrum_lima.AAC.1